MHRALRDSGIDPNTGVRTIEMGSRGAEWEALLTTRRFADATPGTLRAFLAAMLQAYRLFQSDFDTTLPFLAACSKIIDRDVLVETHQVFVREFDQYAPRVAPLAAVARDLAAVRGAPLGLDIERLVDASYLPRDD